jgi:hypothetical protein
MAHSTETKDNGSTLTSQEIAVLINLLKHPKIKDLAKEMEKKDK